MVYVRIKKSKNAEYMYLVKSVWDSEKKTSRQSIIKYLGKVGTATEEDIPSEYRGVCNVAKAVSGRLGADANSYADDLFEALTSGSLEKAMGIYRKATARGGRTDVFFEKTLRPALYRIGQRWADGKLGIATEHVASNVAQAMLRVIQEQVRRGPGKVSVMLCMPAGEDHKIPSDILEAYLTGRGYMVYNLGSLPAVDALSYVNANRPDMVIVSATLQDSVCPAERLVGRIRERFDIPAITGGYAFRDRMDLSLTRVPEIIKRALASA